MHCTRRFAALVTMFALASVAAADDKKGETRVGPALKFKMNGIDGKEIDLARFQGNVVLFVNVASECGLTPQYEGLQKLHDKYAREGLVIIGVPANEFGKQEPGTDADIKEFCANKYGVKFVMLSKVVVKGKGIVPLYQYLTTASGEKFRGDITWNFEKFLVDRRGEVAARFAPSVPPEDEKMVAAIEAQLKSK